MDPARQKEIAQQGGRAAHVTGKAHEFTAEEAQAAGKKGGQTTGKNKSHMAEIGRRGGLAKKKKAKSTD